MLDQKEIQQFFDRLAPDWDADLVHDDAVIDRILTLGGVTDGCRVLDVGCGTGVLFPDYFARGVQLTAIDVSPEMVRCAQAKFPQAQVLCGDAAQFAFPPAAFDAVMVYNAFPHMADPQALFANAAAALRPGGRFTVAHGMSRARLQQHHAGCAAQVSLPLPEAADLAALFAPWFRADRCVSDDRMYLVSGVKEATA